MNEAANDSALTPEAALDRRMPLIPGDSIAGGALVVVVAIMTLLACLTAGGALLAWERRAGGVERLAERLST